MAYTSKFTIQDLDTIDFSLLSLSLCKHFIICVLILDKPVVCTCGVQSFDLYISIYCIDVFEGALGKTG